MARDRSIPGYDRRAGCVRTGTRPNQIVRTASTLCLMSRSRKLSGLRQSDARSIDVLLAKLVLTPWFVERSAHTRREEERFDAAEMAKHHRKNVVLNRQQPHFCRV